MIYIYIDKNTHVVEIRSAVDENFSEPDYTFTDEEFEKLGGICSYTNGELVFGSKEIQYTDNADVNIDILMAKSNLQQTDYIACKLAEAYDNPEEYAQLKSKYQQVLDQRKEWRKIVGGTNV